VKDKPEKDSNTNSGLLEEERMSSVIDKIGGKRARKKQLRVQSLVKQLFGQD
jgi:hypothetical protein